MFHSVFFSASLLQTFHTAFNQPYSHNSSQQLCSSHTRLSISIIAYGSERMPKSIDRPSITPSESSSTTTKDVEVKVDQTSKAVGVAKTKDSTDDEIEKQDVNETPAIESKKQDHDEGDQDCSKKGRKLDTRWEIMFARLLAFKEKHGDCLVPNRHQDDTQLGSWGKQRCHLVCVFFVFVFCGVALMLVLSSELNDIQTYPLKYVLLSYYLKFPRKDGNIRDSLPRASSPHQ
jgi:hypothetical protein